MSVVKLPANRDPAGLREIIERINSHNEMLILLTDFVESQDKGIELLIEGVAALEKRIDRLFEMHKALAEILKGGNP
jgi:hypothetical protein